MYTIKGQTYLEGEFHQDRLFPGAACEYFSESADDWVPAQIIACNSTPSGATFRIQYTVPLAEDAYVDAVKPDVLRLLVPSGESQLNSTVLALAVPEAPPVEESTGIGAWSVVSVREVDEEVERQEAAEIVALEHVEAGVLVNANNLVWDSDDVMASYDPYGTNRYKGVDLGSAERRGYDDEIFAVAKGATVQFKKRKVAAVESGGPEQGNNKSGGNVRSFRAKTNALPADGE